MPSMVIDYVPGSGYTPLFSGSWFSGGPREPVGGVQLYADPANSGRIYISLSGGYPVSGQFGLLVGSGGPTITSGAMRLSGGGSSGLMDGFPLPPGGGYFVPRLGFNSLSGFYPMCAGTDPACSGGFARLYWELM